MVGAPRRPLQRGVSCITLARYGLTWCWQILLLLVSWAVDHEREGSKRRLTSEQFNLNGR